MYRWMLFVLLLWAACPLLAQEKDTLVKKIDSLSTLPDSVNIRRESYNEATRLNGRTYLILLGNDFKQQFTAPFHTRGKDWLKVGGFALAAGGIMLVEKDVRSFSQKLKRNNPAIGEISSYVTHFGATYEVYTLAALATYGFAFKNEKIKTTTYLATQAYITSYVMFTAVKYVVGKQRPSYVNPQTNRRAPIFHGPFYQFTKNDGGSKRANDSYTSFPSGHTTLAFAAATVYAMEYRDRPLVPIIAYSAASLVGLSRMVENKHWASDVLAGAALGYLCGKQVVNNYHRYARVKRGETSKKRNTVTFHMQYLNGTLVLGLIYHLK